MGYFKKSCRVEGCCAMGHTGHQDSSPFLSQGRAEQGGGGVHRAPGCTNLSSSRDRGGVRSSWGRVTQQISPPLPLCPHPLCCQAQSPKQVLPGRVQHPERWLRETPAQRLGVCGGTGGGGGAGRQVPKVNLGAATGLGGRGSGGAGIPRS